MSVSTASKPVESSRIGPLVLTLCLAVVVIDGFDLVIYGTVLPSLLTYAPWAMTPEAGGAIGSYSLLGLLLGAFVSGYITDRFGRRNPIILSTALFSLLTGLCAASNGLLMFGILRFLVGFVLGGVLPMTVALSLEYAPPHRKNFYSAVTQMGYGMGAILVTMVGIVVIPTMGFRALFLIAAALGFVLLPLLWWKLPESVDFLVISGRIGEARALAESYGLNFDADQDGGSSRNSGSKDKLAAVRTMFSPGYRRATVALPVAGFFGFLFAYGMNTWLPQVLREVGYGLGSALAFLMAMNIGNLIGNVVLSRVADRIGARTTVSLAFGGAALCVFALSLELPGAVVYVLLLASGFGALTGQALMFGLGGTFYPTDARGTALGWCMGMSRVGGVFGPLVGGLLLSSSLGTQWSFYAFSAAALCACLIVLVVPRRGRSSVVEHIDE